MNQKIILDLDLKLTQQIKILAEKHNTSVSNLIESYLRKIVKLDKPESQQKPELAPLVRELYGVVAVPDDFDEKAFVTEILMEKNQLNNGS